MRARVSILVVSLLAVLLLAGCSTADVGSLEKFLVDLGVPLDQTAFQQTEETFQQMQAEVQDLRDQLEEQVRSFRLELPIWIRALLILVGVVLLLVGGRVYIPVVAGPGFALGLVVGIIVLDVAQELPDGWVLAIAALIGIVGALATTELLTGAIVSGFLVSRLLETYRVPLSAGSVLILVVCAIAGAIGLLLISRRLPTVMAAILGAVLVSVGLVQNLNLAVIVPAMVIGLGVQALVMALRRRKPEAPKPEAAVSPQYPAYPPQAYQPAAQTPQPYAPPPAQPPPQQVLPPLQTPTPGRAQRPVEWPPQPPHDQPTPPIRKRRRRAGRPNRPPTSRRRPNQGSRWTRPRQARLTRRRPLARC
ncbi:MAG: hypothetical protein M5R40_20910 [Anaerolineae bacterium]|nr:hypothetical protein [Anaerolineae bacterium]